MYHYITTEEQLKSAVQTIRAYLKQESKFFGYPVLALDTETYSKTKLPDYIEDDEIGEDDEEEEEIKPKKRKPVPRCIRLADGSYSGQIRILQIGLDTDDHLPIRDEQFLIDCQALGYDLVRFYLKDILENNIFVGQNLKYDYTFLFAHLGVMLGRRMDVMLMNQVLCAGDKVGNDLGSLYERYLNLPWFINQTKSKNHPNGLTFVDYKIFKKTQQTEEWDGPLSEDQLGYAAQDVRFLFPLCAEIIIAMRKWRAIYEKKPKDDQGIFFITRLENQLITEFALMELRGIKFDYDYHHYYVEPELARRRDEAHASVKITRKVIEKKCNRWCFLENRKETHVSGKLRVVWEEEVEEPIKLTSWQQLKPALAELITRSSGYDFSIQTTIEKDENGKEKKKEKYLIHHLDGTVAELNTREDTIRRYFRDPNVNHDEEVKIKLQSIMFYKKASSLLSKFGHKLCDLCHAGYLYPNWHQLGSESMNISTGRSSCSNPNCMQIPARGKEFESDDDPGLNMEQFFRRSFIPDGLGTDDEWCFVDGDLSQIEARVAAEMCNEIELKKAYKEGHVDIHAWNAKAVMGLDYLPASDSYERKFIGKTYGFMSLFGARERKAMTFMNDKAGLNWTLEDAKKARENYFNTFPGFAQAIAEFEHEVNKVPYKYNNSLASFNKNPRPTFFVAHTKKGRHRGFYLKPSHAELPDWMFDKNCEFNEKGEHSRFNICKERLSAAAREGFNMTIQGTAADILKLAVLKIGERFREVFEDWKEGIVAVIHDQVLCHVRRKHAELAASIVKEAFIEAGNEVLDEVPVEATVNISSNWGEGH